MRCTFAHILVPTDFSTCADRALLHAAALARASDAELHLLHVVVGPEEAADMQGVAGLEAAYRNLEASAAQRLASLLAGSPYQQLRVHPVTRQHGAAAPAILDYAEEHRVDLIVMGTHGRRGAERFLMDSTAEKVVRLAPCTVLTVGPQGGRVASLAKRILVPVDFSRHARYALGWAKAFAARTGARLELLHVIEPVVRPAFYADHPDVLALEVPKVEERAYAALEHFFRKAGGPGVKAGFHVVRGRPAHEIVVFAAREEMHLIVQASLGLRGVAYLLLGSIADEVIRTAPCPVFTVRKKKRSNVHRAADSDAQQEQA